MKEVHCVPFTDLEMKCPGKLGCLIKEMLFIREQKPKLLNTQPDSIRAKVFILKHLPHALSCQTPMTTKHLLFNIHYHLNLFVFNLETTANTST